MIGLWCDGVIAYLADTFGGNADVVAGERDGVHRGEKDLVAVFWPGWDEVSRDIVLAQPTLTVRYFPSISKLPADETPRNPAPIMAAGDALLTAFDRASQAPGFFTENLSSRVTSMRPNYDPEFWRVEATLLAYTLGAGA